MDDQLKATKYPTPDTNCNNSNTKKKHQERLQLFFSVLLLHPVIEVREFLFRSLARFCRPHGAFC